MHDIFVLKLIEDAIASEYNKVVRVLIDFEKAYVRLCYHNFRIAKELWNFCFDVAESSTNTQPSGENSMRAQNNLSLTPLTHYWCILVNLTSTIKNSLNLNRVSWFMIIWQSENLFSTWDRQHRSTVACVCYVTNIVNYKRNYCTRTWSFNITNLLFLTESKLNEQFLSFCKAVSNCLNRILREAIVFNDLIISTKIIHLQASEGNLLKSQRKHSRRARHRLRRMSTLAS